MDHEPSKSYSELHDRAEAAIRNVQVAGMEHEAKALWELLAFTDKLSRISVTYLLQEPDDAGGRPSGEVAGLL